MHKTYEAVYEDGHLRWIGNGPQPRGRSRVLVTVLEHEQADKSSQDGVRRLLEDTRAAWGTEKTLEEVTAEAERLRGEWDRHGSRDD